MSLRFILAPAALRRADAGRRMTQTGPWATRGGSVRFGVLRGITAVNAVLGRDGVGCTHGRLSPLPQPLVIRRW
jgi:hypothetical protein